MKSIKFKNAACASVLLALVTMFMGCSDSIPNNEIHYTSADGNVVEVFLYNTNYSAKDVSNTYKNGKGVIRFKDELKEIPECTFYNSQTLKTINLPKSVTSIGNSAFAYTKNLKAIAIPENVISIGPSVGCGVGVCRIISCKYLIISIGCWIGR